MLMPVSLSSQMNRIGIGRPIFTPYRAVLIAESAVAWFTEASPKEDATMASSGRLFATPRRRARPSEKARTQAAVGTAEEGAWCEVADTGPGIHEWDQPRIFERFYRADKARSREKGGTGLGLSIVKHIVALHGGQVAVRSRPGEGSVFRFEIPL